ncbi:MAG: HAMP domain-containing histidine kinase [Pseudomonadales bacterium]|nr:HAMP domain-containing histidine kinase [Pseudomonadales bacterium]MCP5329721.1 HAMP domain-containing histidine kinase [Pseudomonadales bacterium]MCP5343740.1 HAMP domain-containing histidine kinase [Pseudomonadales bacterium]
MAFETRSLRFRVLLAIVVIVSVTSFLFAGGVLIIKARLEAVIFGEMAAHEFAELTRQLDVGEYQESHLFAGWRFYYDDAISALPEEIRKLPVGSHHSIREGDYYYQVEVGQWQGQPAYLTYDVTNWEQQEHYVLSMLLYGLGIVMVAALIMGISAIRAILAPVQGLSQRLTEIQPGERSLRIAEEYRGTEIGQIAAAFDKYMERLDRFVERERSFTSAASHELRTPLSVMLGAVDVLSSNPQSAASQRAIERIRRACSEMLAFIEATLYMAREEAMQIDQSAPAPLSTIIERVLEDSADMIEARGIRVETHFQGEPAVSVPVSLLQITVSNLLRNAIEHTEEGAIRIEVTDEKFCIADTGEGIAQDKLQQVFERSYSTKEGGTGLGLNLVRRICDRFQWEISIDSHVGEGTTVCVVF